MAQEGNPIWGRFLRPQSVVLRALAAMVFIALVAHFSYSSHRTRNNVVLLPDCIRVQGEGAANGPAIGVSGEHFSPEAMEWDDERESYPPKDARVPFHPVVVGERWIVVTSINYPTPTVRKLASLEGWNVVVVGDNKSPRDWNISSPSCVFLDVETQKRLPFRTNRLSPFNHYGRKNVGYLFAIASGARVIYETDDDNILIGDTIRFLEDDFLQMPVYNVPRRSVVNPYPNFGLRRAWPRGYPLGSIALQPNTEFVDETVRPLVQQGLANGDPDMDAIYRLTRAGRGPGNSKAIIHMEFDDDHPAIALPHYTLTPFNSQNTFFAYDALWALLIPVSTNFRVCDIWRGYWIQRLLWDIGGSLAFLPPGVLQRRNIHDYMRDYVDELPLYADAQRLADFLFDWQPSSPRATLFERMIEMGQDMAVAGFWKPLDARLMAAWALDLQDLGYKEPSVVAGPTGGSNRNGPRVLVPRVLKEVDVADWDGRTSKELDDWMGSLNRGMSY